MYLEKCRNDKENRDIKAKPKILEKSNPKIGERGPTEYMYMGDMFTPLQFYAWVYKMATFKKSCYYLCTVPLTICFTSIWFDDLEVHNW